MATVYLILALLVAILAVIFALQNTATVTIVFFAWSVKGSLSLVLLISLAIGVLIGLLFLSPSFVKNSFQMSGHRKRIGALEKELEEHKENLASLTAEKEKLARANAEASAPTGTPGNSK